VKSELLCALSVFISVACDDLRGPRGGVVVKIFGVNLAYLLYGARHHGTRAAGLYMRSRLFGICLLGFTMSLLAYARSSLVVDF
jgi:hypothetical protein